jgi:hypothetical protein
MSNGAQVRSKGTKTNAKRDHAVKKNSDEPVKSLSANATGVVARVPCPGGHSEPAVDLQLHLVRSSCEISAHLRKNEQDFKRKQ